MVSVSILQAILILSSLTVMACLCLFLMYLHLLSLRREQRLERIIQVQK